MLGSINTLSFSLRDIVKGFRRTSGELAASTSGTLCLSAVCDAKSARERAAVSDARTHCRYGLRDCDWNDQSFSLSAVICFTIIEWTNNLAKIEGLPAPVVCWRGVASIR